MSERPGDNPYYDRHDEPEIEPEMEDMHSEDWLEKWESERALQPNLPARQQQFVATMAMDAFRVCLGMAPRSHTRESIIRWITMMPSIS